MTITRQDVAAKLTVYLHRENTLAQLVDWAETALMEAEFDDQDFSAIRDVIARLGVADVRAFGLAWEDCEDLLCRLGYTAQLDVVAA
ncbi:MAG: hypothetical protein JO295_11020 [Verrucomicrobia bacterium]|nr:hypothetical protein [Verrucomicrobiota bacterium]